MSGPAAYRVPERSVDEVLAALTLAAARPARTDRVLDVACGSGQVARLFHRRVAAVIGVDTGAEARAERVVDRLVVAPAGALPFEDASFDVVVRGPDARPAVSPDAVGEMVRVTRPGGRVVLVGPCAYGPADRDEHVEILRLRDPGRCHGFVAGDLGRMLADAGCATVAGHRYVSVEDVDTWAGESAREAVRRRYRLASPEYRRRHRVREDGGRLTDHMLFEIAVGVR